MRKFYILLGVLVVVTAAVAALYFLGILGNGARPIQSGTVITDQAEISARSLAFVQPPYRDSYGNMRVAGYVDNFGDLTFIAATLSIELRDSDGNREAVLEHTVRDIGAGQRKWFDIDAGTYTQPQNPTVVVQSIEIRR